MTSCRTTQIQHYHATSSLKTLCHGVLHVNSTIKQTLSKIRQQCYPRMSKVALLDRGEIIASSKSNAPLKTIVKNTI